MTIRYNEYVKRPKEELEYTPEQIKELQRCKKNIFSFLKYVKVIHLDKGETVFEPYDYQKKLLKMFQEERKVILLSSRQAGKCCLGNTVVRVRNKTTGEEKDITVEDFFENLSDKT